MVSQELRKPLNQRIAPPSGVRLLYPHWAVGAWLQSAYWPASPANSGSPGRHILCLDPAHPLLHLLLLQLHLQTWETLRPAATQSIGPGPSDTKYETNWTSVSGLSGVR